MLWRGRNNKFKSRFFYLMRLATKFEVKNHMFIGIREFGFLTPLPNTHYLRGQPFIIVSQLGIKCLNGTQLLVLIACYVKIGGRQETTYSSLIGILSQWPLNNRLGQHHLDHIQLQTSFNTTFPHLICIPINYPQHMERAKKETPLRTPKLSYTSHPTQRQEC